jgi:hypothetical protein
VYTDSDGPRVQPAHFVQPGTVQTSVTCAPSPSVNDLRSDVKSAMTVREHCELLPRLLLVPRQSDTILPVGFDVKGTRRCGNQVPPLPCLYVTAEQLYRSAYQFAGLQVTQGGYRCSAVGIIRHNKGHLSLRESCPCAL